jgi:rhodanese-related sulfurtransferase
VAQVLQDNGFKDTRPLKGGFAAWKEAGMPVTSKATEKVT